MQRWWLAVVLVSAACASAPIKKADAEALLEADRRVLSGCYDCLLDARETYSALAVGKARPLLISKLFETQLLIALREKELAIDASAAFAKARELAKELPTAKGTGKTPLPIIDGDRVLAIADALLPDQYGSATIELNALRQKLLPFNKRVDDELAWLKTSALSPAIQQYLTLGLDCDYWFRGGPTQLARVTAGKPALPSDAPALLVYRRAACVNWSYDLDELTQVRSAVPRFVETGFFHGRSSVPEIQRTGNVAKAREPVTEFYQRFPTSSSATYLRGSFSQQIGDCRDALRYYDETIVLKPLHEQALLARTICLTFIKRTEEAIQSATRMIELRTPNVSQAYYWRAWNQHLLKKLPEARADIDAAKKLQANVTILTLAGMIEHDQDDLDRAKSDLQMALKMSQGEDNCEASWYLGLVYMKQTEWLSSGAAFEGAMNCYGGRQFVTEGQRKAMDARTDLDAEFKARQLANFDAVIKESASQRYAGAYNAAHFYARGSNVDKAKGLLEIAAEDPALAQRVAELRKLMGGG